MLSHRTLSALLIFSGLASAQVQVRVPANRLITLAGQPAGTRSTSSRSAPADSPVPANITLIAGQPLAITATGTVDGSGPDGNPGCRDSVAAEFSMARLVAPCRALVAVFLADTTRPQPAAGLDFSNDAREIVLQRPLLQQPFLVGSGVTSSGERKAFMVPAGATRLFFAPLAGARSNGEFVVTVRPTAEPEIPGNPVRVSGVSLVHLAGQAAGTPSANSGRSAPLYAPAQVRVPLVAGQALRIVATGAVEETGPDGQPGCNDSLIAEFAIPRVDARCRSLLGVFLSDTTRAQPPNLNFTGALRNAARVEPLIQQPFLIGSGYTDGGELKQFIVPAGATRLYLGVLSGVRGDGFFLATVSPEAASTPVVQRSGVVRAAGFGTGAASPGAIASIFGAQLADATTSAAAVPLPVQLGTTRVYFNLRPAPLFFTSTGQVNAQVPWELSGETSAQMVVVRNGAASLPVPVELGAASPGIFLLREDTGVVVNAATGQLVDRQAAARAGDVLVIYASGLGPVNGSAASGVPASSTELEPLQQPVQATFTVNGQAVPLPVLFAGSAPGFVGVNQVNVQVPEGAPAGVGALKLATRGIDSNEVSIAVRR